jgi:hypothetical protein
MLGIARVLMVSFIITVLAGLVVALAFYGIHAGFKYLGKQTDITADDIASAILAIGILLAILWFFGVIAISIASNFFPELKGII